MDMGSRNQKMDQSIMGTFLFYYIEIIKKGKSMGMEKFYGLMDQCMKEIFNKISYKVKEPLFGRLKNHMQEIGTKIKCMVKVYIYGLMGGDMKDNLPMIIDKALAHFNGLMGEYIKGSGKMGSSTELEKFEKTVYGQRENGQKANKLNDIICITNQQILQNLAKYYFASFKASYTSR